MSNTRWNPAICGAPYVDSLVFSRLGAVLREILSERSPPPNTWPSIIIWLVVDLLL